jgi:hypothetical protein
VKKQPARLLVSFSFVPRDPDGKNVLEKLDERDKLLIGQLLKVRFGVVLGILGGLLPT